jgi:hypothetical protein
MGWVISFTSLPLYVYKKEAIEMKKNYFKNTYKRKKVKRKSIRNSYEYECKCCRKPFKSQGRFSKLDIKYRDYCSDCRKICFMCRCRHGNRGNTCSKYCADRYKKLCWHWKSNNSINTKTKLDAILSKFNLSLINKDVLRPLFELEILSIQERCNDISNAMFKIQGRRKLINDDSELHLDETYSIDKNTFYLYKDSKIMGKIENHVKP